MDADKYAEPKSISDPGFLIFESGFLIRVYLRPSAAKFLPAEDSAAIDI